MPPKKEKNIIHGVDMDKWVKSERYRNSFMVKTVSAEMLPVNATCKFEHLPIEEIRSIAKYAGLKQEFIDKYTRKKFYSFIKAIPIYYALFVKFPEDPKDEQQKKQFEHVVSLFKNTNPKVIDDIFTKYK